MPQFKYSAVNAVGETVNGVFSAADNASVYRMMKEKNLYPTSIKQVISGKSIMDISLSIGGVGMRDIALFCRQFHTMLDAGITIVKALDILRLQTENKKLKSAAFEIHEQLQKGVSLTDSFRPHGNIFPDLVINMVETGEARGSLDKAMDNLAVHYEKETKIKSKISGAMVYPMILSIFASTYSNISAYLCNAYLSINVSIEWGVTTTAYSYIAKN